MNEDELQRELERLARSVATSGRARLAKVAAIRTLQRARRARGLDEQVPVDDDGRFHPGGPEWWELDRCDSDAVREGWRERLSR